MSPATKPSLSVSLSSAAPEKVVTDLLGVGVFQGRSLAPAAAAVDAAMEGGLLRFLEESGFEGKPDEVLAIPTGARISAKAVVAVGLGEYVKLTPAGLRRAGAAFARRAAKAEVGALALLEAVPSNVSGAEAAQALAEGVLLGAYRFLRYKGDPTPAPLSQVLVLGKGAKLKSGLERGTAIARAVNWARDMVNEPAGSLTPSDLAKEASRMAGKRGLKVEVLDEVAIRNERLGGLLGVSLGSDQPPRLVKLTYQPTRPKGTVALVGKGITFDSGGLSIKTAEGMETMKTDMSGAAAVLGAMSVLAELGVKVRVLGFVPTTENMPGGRALKPGDVIKARNGKTIEVLNTDAEGRLVLADGLSLAVEEGVDAIVDVATLTGACMVALGMKVAGLMGNHDGWVAQVKGAAERAGEAFWPLPLPQEYRKELDSEVADLRNIGAGRYGGALTAGLFLSEFTGDIPWAHLDIAGPARAAADDGPVAKGGTGFAVRTLVELLAGFERPGQGSS